VELFTRTLASSRVSYTCNRFFPSKAKAIGDRVIADVLNGTTYDEDDTKNWSVEISDKIRHDVAGTDREFVVSSRRLNVLLLQRAWDQIRGLR
jgi:hypothetical protein